MDQITLNDFKINRLLAVGGFGRVYLVRKVTGIDRGNMYVLKASLRSNNSTWAKNERQILELIKGRPHLAQMIYAFQSGIATCIVMMWGRFGDLGQQIGYVNPLTEANTRWFMAGAVRGLEHLHSLNILHKDLKPDNIIIDSRGFTFLTDFGLSEVNPGKTFLPAGTPFYIAPEVGDPSGFSKPADWWSLGIITYELLTGKRNTDAIPRTADILKMNCSEQAKAFVLKLLMINPKNRLGNGDQTLEVKDAPFFSKKFWKKYEYSYCVTPEPFQYFDIYKPPFDPDIKSFYFNTFDRIKINYVDEKMEINQEGKESHLQKLERFVKQKTEQEAHATKRQSLLKRLLGTGKE